MLLVDALNEAAQDLSTTKHLKVEERDKLWTDLIEIYPKVPLLMANEMERRRVVIADDTVVTSTIEKILQMPRVRESELLKSVVNDAASKVWVVGRPRPSKEVRSITELMGMYQPIMPDSVRTDLVLGFREACVRAGNPRNLIEGLTEAFKEFLEGLDHDQLEKAWSCLGAILPRTDYQAGRRNPDYVDSPSTSGSR